MPTDPNALEPTRKVVLQLQKIRETLGFGARRASDPALGRLTQQFFLEGEQREATNYDGLVLDDAAIEPPKVEFDSFDKIPHKRRPVLGLFVLAVLVGFGTLAWRSFGGLLRENSWVKAATRAMVPPEPAPAPTPTPTPAPPVAAPTAEVPAAAAPETDPPVVQRSDEAAASRHPKPLRGYVWSPTTGDLVPADRAPALPGRDVDRSDDGIMTLPEEPAVTPPPPASTPDSTAPPRFEPRPTPGNGAPIIE